jgi:diguanylate cyclase (GGDEF)-like protein/PAS domain S-box-containing protein
MSGTRPTDDDDMTTTAVDAGPSRGAPARLMWPVLLVVVLVAASTAAFATTMVTGRLWPESLGRVLNLVVAVLTVLLCRHASLDPSSPPLARHIWRLSAWGLALSTVALVARRLGADGVLPVPPVGPNVVQTAGVFLLSLSLLRIPLGTRNRAERVALLLDMCTLLVAGAVFVWHVVGENVLEAVAAGRVRDLPPSLALTVIAVVLAAKAALAGSEVLPRRALYLRAAGAILGGLAAISVLLTSRSDLDLQVLLNPLAVGAIALSAWFQVTDGADATTRARRRRYSVQPYVAVGAVFALLVATSVRGSADHHLVLAATGVLTAVVVARQLHAFRENDHLLTELGRRERQFRLLVQNGSDVVTITEPDGTIRYVSPSVRRVLGRDPAVLVGTYVLADAHADDRAVARATFLSLAPTPGATATYVLRVQHADGGWRWLEVVLSNLMDEPSVAGWVSNARDITETREVQARLSHQATHDALTGLANRFLFGERVQAALDHPDPDHRVSLALVDLDDFKSVNDTWGHAAGDELLVTVAERMRACVRPADTVARLGGDEFAILVEDLDAPAVGALLDRMAAALLVPAVVGGAEVSVRASVGVVERSAGESAEELLRHADTAMYEVKSLGEGGHRRYRSPRRPDAA